MKKPLRYALRTLLNAGFTLALLAGAAQAEELCFTSDPADGFRKIGTPYSFHAYRLSFNRVDPSTEVAVHAVHGILELGSKDWAPVTGTAVNRGQGWRMTLTGSLLLPGSPLQVNETFLFEGNALWRGKVYRYNRQDSPARPVSRDDRSIAPVAQVPCFAQWD